MRLTLFSAIAALSVIGCDGPAEKGETTAAATAPAATDVPPLSRGSQIATGDLFHLRSVTDVQVSPDGSRATFTVISNDRIGAPWSQIWIADLAAGKAMPWPGAQEGSNARWSKDGARIAFIGPTTNGRSGVLTGNADGTGVTALADVMSSNSPLPQLGERIAWSPDGSAIAFVSAVPAAEPDMNGDPIVITRYWYRPATSYPLRFNDNRRLHLFSVDVASKQVRRLTTGRYDEHSIAWSPDGDELAFLSDREPDPDRFFNYDIFLLNVASGDIRQLTQTKSNEYRPAWSPDGRLIAYEGLKRPMTSSETNSEDTHVWTVDVGTGGRREVGAGVDNRQGPPQWSSDGRWLYATVQSQGNVGLHRFSSRDGDGERVLPAAGVRAAVSSFALAKDDAIVYAMATPAAPPELYLDRAPAAAKAITGLNQEALAGKTIAEVEAVRFRSFDGRDIEAFLTKPAQAGSTGKHPMIVMIHGGPHGQQGPAFNHRAQVYAARGWAALMVNYRGSTGYGQKFSDAIARDQDGGEAKDVLAAIDTVLARYSWIDRERLGVEGQSYGGQLTNWLVTQTTRFKAAVPAASISNLVSHNYMSVYHDYLQQEYGAKPHVGGIVDLLWERSAIRFVNRVKTPVMFIHGDNDQLVNPAEIEQFFIALQDVGVETVMVRYPREGHGMRENGHIADVIKRSIDWYERHFQNAAPRVTH
jgi:dipeptidyl aminopeptidase/acylaminoacyl peptidase